MDEYRELFVLLHGNVKSGQLAAQAIVDLAAESLNEAPIDELLHELCTVLLVSAEWTTRVNTGYTIRLLCAHFQDKLIPPLLDSPSDGDLLHISDLNVDKIYKCGCSDELLSGHSTYIEESSQSRLYGKKWLVKQQRALHKRLGLESYTDAQVSKSIKFIAAAGQESLLVEEDVAVVSVRGLSRDKASPRQEPSLASKHPKKKPKIGRSSDTVSGQNNLDDDVDDNNEATSEAPFARLLRFLVVGLMDRQWEIRHGCAVGLTGAINGLTARGKEQSSVIQDYSVEIVAPSMALFRQNDSSNSSSTPSPARLSSPATHAPSSGSPSFTSLPLLPLPMHLIDDILCTGACTLMLDRFVDFCTPSTVVSPVKEAVAQLMACATLCLSSRRFETAHAPMVPDMGKVGSLGGDEKVRCILAIALDMSSYHGHWTARLGGLVLLKYLLPTQPSLVSARSHTSPIQRRGVSAGNTANRTDPEVSSALARTIALLCDCLKDPMDDVRGSAAAVVHSLYRSLVSSPVVAAQGIRAASDPQHENCAGATNSIGSRESFEFMNKERYDSSLLSLLASLCDAADALDEMSTACCAYCQAVLAITRLLLDYLSTQTHPKFSLSTTCSILSQSMAVLSRLLMKLHLFSNVSRALCMVPLEGACTAMAATLTSVIAQYKMQPQHSDAHENNGSDDASALICFANLACSAARLLTAAMLSIASKSLSPCGMGSSVLVNKEESVMPDDRASVPSFDDDVSVGYRVAAIAAEMLHSCYDTATETRGTGMLLKHSNVTELSLEEQALSSACSGGHQVVGALVSQVLLQRCPLQHTTPSTTRIDSELSLLHRLQVEVKNTMAHHSPMWRMPGNPESDSVAELAGRKLHHECSLLRLCSPAGGVNFAQFLASLCAFASHDHSATEKGHLRHAYGDSEPIGQRLLTLIATQLEGCLRALGTYRNSIVRNSETRPSCRLIIVVGGGKGTKALDGPAPGRKRCRDDDTGLDSFEAHSAADPFPALRAAESCCEASATCFLLLLCHLMRPSSIPAGGKLGPLDAEAMQQLRHLVEKMLSDPLFQPGHTITSRMVLQAAAAVLEDDVGALLTLLVACSDASYAALPSSDPNQHSRKLGNIGHKPANSMPPSASSGRSICPSTLAIITKVAAELAGPLIRAPLEVMEAWDLQLASQHSIHINTSSSNPVQSSMLSSVLHIVETTEGEEAALTVLDAALGDHSDDLPCRLLKYAMNHYASTSVNGEIYGPNQACALLKVIVMLCKGITSSYTKLPSRLLEQGIVPLIVHLLMCAASGPASEVGDAGIVDRGTGELPITQHSTLATRLASDAIQALSTHTGNTSTVPKVPPLAQLADLLQQFITQNSGSSHKFATVPAISLLCLHLTHHLPVALILPSYEAWLGLVLRGIALPSGYGEPFVGCFRLLVPLAALVRNRLPADLHGATPAAAVTRLILARESPPRLTVSPNEYDREIIIRLARGSNIAVSDWIACGPSTQVGLALRGYQWDGITWLTFLRRAGLSGILADEMGLGKSVQALVSLAILYIEDSIEKEKQDLVARCVPDAEVSSGPGTSSAHPASSNVSNRTNSSCQLSLLVCPAALVSHWMNETSKFFAVDRASVVSSGARGESPSPLLQAFLYHKSTPLPDLPHPGLIIASYDALRSSQVLQSHHWAAVVLDEAHVIRNPTTALAKAIYKLSSNSSFRVCLTGTPVMNHVEELWSLCHFLLPGYLGPLKDFRHEVSRVIHRGAAERLALARQSANAAAAGSTIDSNDDRTPTQSRHGHVMMIALTTQGLIALRRLHKQVLPLLLRRLKINVAAELPPKTIIDVPCPLSPIQADLYKDFQRGLRLDDRQLAAQLENIVRDGAVPPVTTNGASPSMHPLRALLYLKLLCVHPALCISADHDAYKCRLLGERKSSGKMLALVRLLVDSGVVGREEMVAGWDDGDVVDQGDAVASGSDESKGDEDDDDDDEDDDDDTDDDEESNEPATTEIQPSSGVPCDQTYLGDGEEVEEEDEHGSVVVVVKPRAIRNVCSNVNESRGHQGPGHPSAKRARSEVSGTKGVRTDVSTKFSSNPRRSARLACSTQPPSNSSASSALHIHNSFPKHSTARHRCLVFATHRATLDIIEQCVLKRMFPTVPYARLDGTIPAAQRAVIAERFNSQPSLGFMSCSAETTGPAGAVGGMATRGSVSGSGIGQRIGSSAYSDSHELRMLLATTGACGTGLTLTAADTVIFVEHDWNPFVDLQAMDRAHRIGQTNPVTVYRLLAESTIEARIMGLQAIKTGVAAEVMTDDNAAGAGAVLEGVGAALGRSRGVEQDESREYDGLDVDAFLASL